jgi:hypothetical protein
MEANIVSINSLKVKIKRRYPFEGGERERFE